MISNNGKIPFLDLVTLHEELEAGADPCISKGSAHGGFCGRPDGGGIREGFRGVLRASHCVGLASGTDAVRFALMAAGVQPGDMVLTVPHTFIATTEAISARRARGRILWTSTKRTYCMDPAKLQEYLAKKCYFDRETGKPYHRQSRSAGHGDCAGAYLRADCGHGSDSGAGAAIQFDRGGRRVPGSRRGVFFEEGKSLEDSRVDGRCGGFQLLPGEESGACGEAGAATTNSESIARKCA